MFEPFEMFLKNAEDENWAFGLKLWRYPKKELSKGQSNPGDEKPD